VGANSLPFVGRVGPTSFPAAGKPYLVNLSRLSLLYPRQLSICVEMNGHQSRERKIILHFCHCQKVELRKKRAKWGESKNGARKKSEPPLLFFRATTIRRLPLARGVLYTNSEKHIVSRAPFMI